MIQIKDNEMLMRFEILNEFSNLTHFVTTRKCGVSLGSYAGFNCSPFSGDDLQAVVVNQQLLRTVLGKNLQFLIPHQTHSNHVLAVQEDFFHSEGRLSGAPTYSVEDTDALITDIHGICLCIFTADCVPILLYDPICQVIGAVHAGWRGTVSHIVAETVKLMQVTYQTDSANLVVAMGPSISLQDFEVGVDVYDAFMQAGFDMSSISLYDAKAKKYHLDLWKANKKLLIDCGVQSHHIEISGISTYTSHQLFFSARRLGIKSGRILSGIQID